MKYGLRILFVLGLIVMAGCTRINSSNTVQASAGSRWGIAAFTNNTEIPQAGFRAMSITAGILRSKGVHNVLVYPANANCSKLIVCPGSTPSPGVILSWARSKGLQYLMMGAVNEWDYKVGLDGEPIAGVALQLYSVGSGTIIWSSVGSKSGTSRSGLSVIAQRLITEMLQPVKTGAMSPVGGQITTPVKTKMFAPVKN